MDVVDDRSNPHLRPDFVDTMFEHSSDDSLGDLYENDDFDDFFGPGEGGESLEDYLITLLTALIEWSLA